MRACLLLCAALALAPSRPRAAASHRHAPAPAPAHAPHAPPHAPPHVPPHAPTHDTDPARLDHIKVHILAKLGLSSRPTPLGAPPRDVVRQILARAADPSPEHHPEPEHSMREIIAIAHRDAVQKHLNFQRATSELKLSRGDCTSNLKINGKKEALHENYYEFSKVNPQVKCTFSENLEL